MSWVFPGSSLTRSRRGPGGGPVEFEESISLAAVVDVCHHDVARRIEAEEDAPLADAQPIPAFQSPLQRLHVAATVGSKDFQSVNNPPRVGAVHLSEFALSGRLVDQKPFHRSSCCFNSR